MKSKSIKARAACFLRVYVSIIDEATRSVVELVIILLSGSIEQKSLDSEVMKAIKYNINYEGARAKGLSF